LAQEPSAETGGPQAAPPQVAQPVQPPAETPTAQIPPIQQQQLARQAAQPQAPAQPGLTATIGDMIKQKPLRLGGTDVLGIPPEVAKRMPQKELEKQKAAAMAKQQKPTGLPQTRPGDPLDLPTVGATPEEVKLISKASEKANPTIDQLMTAMKWGDVQTAQQHLNALRQSGFKAPEATKATKAEKMPSAEEKSTKALKKQQVQMPPEQQFKDIVGTAATQALPPAPQKYTPPSPAQLKPQGYVPPSPKKFEKAMVRDPQGEGPAEPIIPLTREKEKGAETPKKEKRAKQRKENTTGTEGDEPIMTMADFMRQSKDDPEQISQAKQKIDQERELQKRPKKSKSKGKILIRDIDKGARIKSKFMTSDERKTEGY